MVLSESWSCSVVFWNRHVTTFTSAMFTECVILTRLLLLYMIQILEFFDMSMFLEELLTYGQASQDHKSPSLTLMASSVESAIGALISGSLSATWLGYEGCWRSVDTFPALLHVDGLEHLHAYTSFTIMIHARHQQHGDGACDVLQQKAMVTASPDSQLKGCMKQLFSAQTKSEMSASVICAIRHPQTRGELIQNGEPQ